jgi:hypothetical protein
VCCVIDRCNCRNIQAVRAFAVIGILTAGLAFTGAAAVYWLRTVEPPMVKMRLGFMGMAGERRCHGLAHQRVRCSDATLCVWCCLVRMT